MVGKNYTNDIYVVHIGDLSSKVLWIFWGFPASIVFIIKNIVFWSKLYTTHLLSNILKNVFVKQKNRRW